MAESKKDLIINVKGQKILVAPDVEAAATVIDASAQKIIAAMQSAGEAIVGLKTTIKGQAAEIKSGFDSIKNDAESMAKSVDASVKKAAASRAKASKAPAVPQEPSGQSRTTKYAPRVATGKSIPVMPPEDSTRYQEWLKSRAASSRRVPFSGNRHEIQDFGMGGRPPYVQKLGRHSTAANDRAKEQIIRDIELSRRVANFGGPDIETLRKPLGSNRLRELRKLQASDLNRATPQIPMGLGGSSLASFVGQAQRKPPVMPTGNGGSDLGSLFGHEDIRAARREASGEVGDRMQAHAAFEALRRRRESESESARYQEWLRSREVSSQRTVNQPANVVEYGPARPTAAESRRMDAANNAFVQPVGQYGPQPTPQQRQAVGRNQQVGQAAQQLATGAGLYGTSRSLMPTELQEAYTQAEAILNARRTQLQAVVASTASTARERAIAEEEIQIGDARLRMNRAQSAGLRQAWARRLDAERALADAILAETNNPSARNRFATQTARSQFQQANRNYEAVRNPHASQQGVGGQNLTFAAGQLAYGVEDFFQVLAAGQSPMRAFLGAANNIGPALALIGVSGMHASIGIAAALGVTALFAGSSKRAKEAANDWRKSLDQLHDSAEKFAKLRRQVSEFGSSSSMGVGGSRGFLDATRRLRETPVNAGFESSRFRAEELSAEKRTINARRTDEPMALSAARSTGEAIAYAFAQRIPVELSRFGRGLGLDFTERRRFSTEMFQSPKDFGEMSKEMGTNRRGQGMFGNALGAAMGYGAYRRIGSRMTPLAGRLASGLAGWAANAAPAANPMAAMMGRAAGPTFGVLAPLVRTMPVFARLLPVLGRVLNAARLGSMATPAGFAANAAITVGGMMLGKSIGDSIERRFRGGVSAEDETRINKTVGVEKEKFKELKESGAYKRMEDAIRELDMAIQHRAELVKSAAKIPQFMSQAWDAASEIEQKFGARGLRDEVVRGSASDIVQGEQSIRQADSDVRERLAEAEAEKARAEKELQDLKTGGSRFRNVRDEYLADNPGSTKEAANLHATASLFNDMQAANAKAILARKNVEMIKGAPEAERRIQEERIKGFNQQLGKAGFGLRHFNDILPGIVSDGVFKLEATRTAIPKIKEDFGKMNASDQRTILKQLAFAAEDRKPAQMMAGEDLWKTIQTSVLNNTDPSLEVEKETRDLIRELLNEVKSKAKPAAIAGHAMGGRVGGDQRDTKPILTRGGEVVVTPQQQEKMSQLTGVPAGKLFGESGVPGFAYGGWIPGNPWERRGNSPENGWMGRVTGYTGAVNPPTGQVGSSVIERSGDQSSYAQPPSVKIKPPKNRYEALRRKREKERADKAVADYQKRLDAFAKRSRGEEKAAAGPHAGADGNFAHHGMEEAAVNPAMSERARASAKRVAEKAADESALKSLRKRAGEEGSTGWFFEGQARDEQESQMRRSGFSERAVKSAKKVNSAKVATKEDALYTANETPEQRSARQKIERDKMMAKAKEHGDAKRASEAPSSQRSRVPFPQETKMAPGTATSTGDAFQDRLDREERRKNAGPKYRTVAPTTRRNSFMEKAEIPISNAPKVPEKKMSERGLMAVQENEARFNSFDRSVAPFNKQGPEMTPGQKAVRENESRWDKWDSEHKQGKGSFGQQALDAQQERLEKAGLNNGLDPKSWPEGEGMNVSLSDGLDQSKILGDIFRAIDSNMKALIGVNTQQLAAINNAEGGLI